MKVLKNSSFDYKLKESNLSYNNSKNISINNENSEGTILTNLDEHLDTSSSKINMISFIKENNTNSLHSLNKRINNKFIETPLKFNEKIQKFEYIPDIFNNSTTENKEIMVSDLDIPLGTPIKFKTQISKQKTSIIEKESDFKKELEKNIIECLEKNGRIKKCQSSTEKKSKMKKNVFESECMEKMNKNQNSHRGKNNLCLSIINQISLKPQIKNKVIYKTVQKKKKNVNIYQVFQDISERKYIGKNKYSLINNISLTNCSTSCTHKGNNNQIYYKLNTNNNYKNFSKSTGKSKCHPINNYKNQIFKTFWSEAKDNLNDNIFMNYTPKNIKKSYVNKNDKNKKENSVSKEKITFTQKRFESLIDNINKKHSIYSEEYKQLFSDYNKNKNKLLNKQLENVQRLYQNKHITIYPIHPLNLKLFGKKLKKNKIGKIIDIESSLGDKINEKYVLNKNNQK